MKNKISPISIKKTKPYVYTENDLGEGKLHEGVRENTAPIKNKKQVHLKFIPGNFKSNTASKVKWLYVEEDFNYAYYY